MMVSRDLLAELTIKMNKKKKKNTLREIRGKAAHATQD